MTNTVFLKSIHQSHWESLKISFPLMYQYYDSLNYGAIEYEKEYPKIDNEFDELIFIDHLPHPLEFFKINSHLLKNDTKFTFHVYGDFFLYLEHWCELFNLLENESVCFVTCSKTHQSFLQKLIKGGSYSILPHFIEDHFFEKVHVNKEFDFMYCGRITSQKNVDVLVKCFINFKKDFPQAKLALIGAIDNYGYHYLGERKIQNDDFVVSLKKLKALSSDIIFLGKKDNKEIPSLIAKAKFLISPSTFHEEDFGRIVPEAIACGSYPLISNWGGYKDFIQLFDLSNELKAIVQDDGIVSIDESSLLKLMKDSMSRVVDMEKSIQLCKENYSLSSFLGKVIKKEHKKLNGNSELMLKCLDVYKKGYGPIFEDNNELQEEVYECYLK